MKINRVILTTIIVTMLSIVVFIVIQEFVKQTEINLLDSIRVQYPKYVETREEILNSLVFDRDNRYLVIAPIFILLYSIGVYFVTKKILGDEQEKLEKSNTEFLQDVSHEIKTPVFALRSSLDLIKRKKNYKKADSDYFIESVDSVTKRLSSQIESIIILSKSNSEFSAKEKINASDLLKHSVDIVKLLASTKGMSIQIKISPEILIKAQERYLNAVFTNILDNAIKYGKNDSTVEVNLSRLDNEKIRFSCKNTTELKVLPNSNQLFAKFYRGRNALETGIEGSGLGLSVVKTVCDSYGWNILTKTEEGDFEIEIVF